MFDYIYDLEGEQFSFLRVPKILLQHEAFSRISAEAKLLYGLLLDRVGMSFRNGWKDNLNRVYIIFTIDEIKEALNCGNKKAIQLLDELESKAGLIERKRQGLGKPNLIYVKSFIRTVDKYGERHFLTCQNDTSGSVKMTSQEVSESHPNNTEFNKTDKNHTDLSFLPGSESKGIDKTHDYEAYFRDQLDYEILLKNNPLDRETLEGILDLLVEVCTSKRRTIRIAGDDKPAEVVKSRFMKLDSSHIDFVLDCLKENTTSVRDMKQYLLTTLFNAPTTISAYYQAKVNYDFYGSHGR